jgi:hypothetical protein
LLAGLLPGMFKPNTCLPFCQQVSRAQLLQVLPAPAHCRQPCIQHTGNQGAGPLLPLMLLVLSAPQVLQ